MKIFILTLLLWCIYYYSDTFSPVMLFIFYIFILIIDSYVSYKLGKQINELFKK